MTFMMIVLGTLVFFFFPSDNNSPKISQLGDYFTPPGPWCPMPTLSLYGSRPRRRKEVLSPKQCHPIKMELRRTPSRRERNINKHSMVSFCLFSFHFSPMSICTIDSCCILDPSVWFLTLWPAPVTGLQHPGLDRDFSQGEGRTRRNGLKMEGLD